MSKPEFCIVGAGVVGTAVATLLTAKGYPLVGVSSRSLSTAQKLAQLVGDTSKAKQKKSPISIKISQQPWEVTEGAKLVFITTPDKAINQVCGDIQAHHGFAPGTIVIHMSGALTSDSLQPAKVAGTQVLSLHPLQSFARVEEAITNLPGSVFTLEGDWQAEAVGFAVINDLGGQGFVISKANKALYHGAAVIAANYLVSLAHLSTGILEGLGIPREKGVAALIPLMQGVLKNIQALGPAKALTGPIARGDSETIERHIQCLAELPKEHLQLYRVLGAYTVKVALEKGSIDQQTAGNLLAVLKKEE
jgi:predicted short-subunit dehydrogenase-like oxidoreductase (DUF2520 family)